MASYNVPHRAILQDGLRPGSVIRVRGTVPDNASRFHVNLLCSEGSGADTALHCNPRLDTGEMVFNTFEKGAWGQEERSPHLPFQRGQPFDLLLIAGDDSFKAVTGDHMFHRFSHRMPLGLVRVLEVGGDVQLQNVAVL
ncbi:galectin-7 [Monodelphis domestica]|uniref:galectin-7 n=1 Tax=Monodelphis domestica TaxID=13616 RepID=UPI0000F2D114|nr:galectin-7 [Monodelphis domestica]